MYFLNTKNSNWFYLYFLCNYFEAIQTDLFHYKKNLYEMLKRNSNMFLDLWGSCDQNIKRSRTKTEYCNVVSDFDILASWDSKACIIWKPGVPRFWHLCSFLMPIFGSHDAKMPKMPKGRINAITRKLMRANLFIFYNN